MARIDPGWRQRLGTLVRERRLARGLSVSRAAKLAGGMDRATWTGIEEGNRETEDYSLAKVEPVLYWQRGSIDAIRTGRDPIELPLPEQEVAEVRRRPSIDDIPSDLLRRGDRHELMAWIREQPWEDGEKFEVAQQLYEAAEEPEQDRRAAG